MLVVPYKPHFVAEPFINTREISKRSTGPGWGMGQGGETWWARWAH